MSALPSPFLSLLFPLFPPFPPFSSLFPPFPPFSIQNTSLRRTLAQLEDKLAHLRRASSKDRTAYEGTINALRAELAAMTQSRDSFAVKHTSLQWTLNDLNEATQKVCCSP